MRDAVVRNLEIIGEATKAVPKTLKNEHPHIPWKQMSGLSDKLIHNYFHIDYEIVWNVIENELPQLAKNIRELLSTLP